MNTRSGGAGTPPARRRGFGFGALLALTMASSTFALTAFSVLSGPLLDTFGLSRWQLGALVTGTAGVGACTSPVLGRFSDRLGGRGAVQVTLGFSALALAGIALSPTYVVLLAAALTAGLAQATANPATNKVIGVHVADGSRGTVTGVKQAGVQVGVFLGGAFLPLGAVHVGWRATVALVATVPLLGLAVSHWLLPGTPRVAERPAGHGSVWRSPFLRRLAFYGVLIGAGWSAVFTYLPDYARTALGWDPTAAGLLVSLSGLCGIAGRIGWGRVAERRLGASATLMTLAAIGLVAVFAVLAARRGQLLLWPAAAALGASSGSWNSVGMFAIIDRMPSQIAGAASGVVMFGFLVGVGIGAPPFGWAVDTTGSFAAGLIAVAVVHLAAFWVARALRDAPVAVAEPG